MATRGPIRGRRIDWRGQDITLRTAAISASWTVAPQGLRPTIVRDESPVSPRERGVPAGPRSLTLGGEVFQIVLSGAQRYPASALIVEGKPRVSEVAPDPKAAQLAARIPARQVELTLHSLDGRLRVVWRAVIHDGANYVRQEIEVSPAREDCVVQEIIWLDEDLPAARTAGRVDGSPVVVGDFFAGCEDPHALNLVAAAPSKLGPGQRADADGKSLLSGSTGRASCRLRRDAPLHRGETLTQSFVFGVAPPGQIRRAFLYYLERERAHPYRPFLHYNSWYDIAWDPFALNEANCLDAIRLCGDHLIKEHGVVVDAMVFDDGWDDPRTLWQFHRGFPRGFSPLADLCEQYGTHLGVWLSPFGGYGSPREQRLAFGRQQGFEVNANGFSLAGPKYYAAFKRACLGMMRNYRVNHFKFDGIASGMSASGPGAGYLLDTEAMRRLMLELRQEDPNVYVNLTTGSWPSPFWLRFADSVWRQGGDMGLAGKGGKQQQWLTYRDQETYRNIVCRGPLFPLNSLMTQGVAYSRRGTAGEPTFNSAGFKDDVRAFFGSGTGLQELVHSARQADGRGLERAGRGRQVVPRQCRRPGRHPLARRRSGKAGGLGFRLVVAAQGHRDAPQSGRPAAGLRPGDPSCLRAAARRTDEVPASQPVERGPIQSGDPGRGRETRAADAQAVRGLGVRCRPRRAEYITTHTS